MITRDMLSQFRHLLRPVEVKVSNMIARGVVQVVDSAKKMQILQLGVQDSEDVDDVENFQQYGHHSVPLAGAETIVVFPGGDRGAPVGVVTDDRRTRPTDWASGDAGLYNAGGAMVRANNADGTVEAGSAAGPHAALATLADLNSLVGIIAAMAPVAGDGGAALKTALASWAPTGTIKLKAD